MYIHIHNFLNLHTEVVNKPDFIIMRAYIRTYIRIYLRISYSKHTYTVVMYNYVNGPVKTRHM